MSPAQPEEEEGKEHRTAAHDHSIINSNSRNPVEDRVRVSKKSVERRAGEERRERRGLRHSFVLKPDLTPGRDYIFFLLLFLLSPPLELQTGVRETDRSAL